MVLHSLPYTVKNTQVQTENLSKVYFEYLPLLKLPFIFSALHISRFYNQHKFLLFINYKRKSFTRIWTCHLRYIFISKFLKSNSYTPSEITFLKVDIDVHLDTSSALMIIAEFVQPSSHQLILLLGLFQRLLIRIDILPFHRHSWCFLYVTRRNLLKIDWVFLINRRIHIPRLNWQYPSFCS